MARMRVDYVDAIVTDPPYELKFASSGWDGTGVSFQIETWTAALRVLKPGGYAVIFGGTRTHHRLWCAVEDAGFEVRDCLMWLYGQGFPKSKNLDGRWQGWGTALKPAWEPILLARKPLSERTVAANVQRWGTGAINVDGCRIGTGGQGKWESPRGGIWKTDSNQRAVLVDNPSGRWPANLCLNEEAAAMLDAQSGEKMHGAGAARGGIGNITGTNQSIFGGDHVGNGMRNGDSGGASRFFYCPKASTKERGVGNTHPTVKPLALMRWLVTLVTPPGGIVLDPFAGSGTTLLAARELGFGVIGIELSTEYCEIIKQRLLAV